ncbi:hypothetical protein [Methylomonas koyamae]|uniref:hypothetical protein n=1 Tax=Methylomonas koyamae TaxID=702114 RepID=UPI0011268432|nr:hypothetical protein [Methylomonas koyamae]TPQ24986.1 hypothetical protein C2U68_17045 [Methylomonas koyamae]
MAKRKSSFYHVRWNRVGLNEAKAAEVLGVTVEDVRQFDETGNPLAERVLLLWDRKNVGLPGWEKFYFSRGLLMCGRRRWDAETIQRLKDQEAEIDQLRSELERLRRLPRPLRILRALANS